MSVRLLGNGVLSYPNIKNALEILFKEKPIAFFASVEFEIDKNKYETKVPVTLLDYHTCAEARYDLTSCKPLDAALLDSLNACEVTYLKMIDRLDWAESMSYGERKTHYLRQVQFWNDFIDRNQINLAIFSNFPHEMYDYVYYCICQLKGIKTLILDDLNFLPDTLFIVEKMEDSCLEIKRQYELIKSSQEIAILTKSKKYYEDFHGKLKNVTPQLIQDLLIKKKNVESLRNKARSIFAKISRAIASPKKFLDIDVWHRLKHSAEKKEAELNLFYNQHATPNPDLTAPFIFLALHYQPECSSCPMGGAFVEQELIAELISKNLPKGYFLYVKEHPLQKKYGRSISLYKKLIELPNVKLISKDFQSYPLTENARAVATITGTVGWEALLKAKPVLKFGSSFYQYAPGVFKIRTDEDCRKALQVIDQGFSYSQEDVKQYLLALERSSINSWVLDFIKEPISTLNKEQLATNLASAFRKYFDQHSKD